MTKPWKINGKGQFYAPVGCDECRHTGYMGRVGIYEMMPLTDSLRGAIGPDSDARSIRKLAIKAGMAQLRISGARMVAMGMTTMDEVLKVVPPDEEI
jgi:general secretion pathway protein E